MVELAISLMGFLLLTMGTADFGWAVYAYNFCSYAAQDAARWASVHGSQSAAPANASAVTNYVKSEAVGLSASQLSVTSCWAGTCLSDSSSNGGTPASGANDPGQIVTVTVQYNYSPLSGLGIRQTLTMNSTAQFVINH